MKPYTLHRDMSAQNKITWFTDSPGPETDALSQLESFARKMMDNASPNILRELYRSEEQPMGYGVDMYFCGMQGFFKNKASRMNMLFIEGFYHHNQYLGFYQLLKELLAAGVTIAIASEEYPHELIKDFCNEVNAEKTIA